MLLTRLAIPDVVRIDLEPKNDSRGFFARMLCRDELHAHGISFDIVQCNNSLTLKSGSVRGMHFQRHPKAETKIIRCVRGAIVDVALDLRAHSHTYGESCACELSAENRSLIVIPPGFAHGFQTLTDEVELIYFHSEVYSPDCEGGVSPLDDAVRGHWPLPVTELSARDQTLPPLSCMEPIQS